LGKMYVSDIRDRSQVDSQFLVKEKITAMAKNGKPYLTLKLMDKTGEVEGKVWDNVDELAAAFAKDDFIAVRSKATIYLGKMQLVIGDLRRIPDDEVVLADFLPESGRDVTEMAEELTALVATMHNAHLKRLLAAFFEDPEMISLYRCAPAAKGMHHVYLGGLLEHSLAVARLVDSIAPLYEGVDRDLLIAGALLHDVGKVREMTYSRSFDYTDEGKLLGHIMIGVEMVQEKVAAIEGFPRELAMLLKHMLLSHHGQYEFGSPKRPKTVEATILNYLDDLDSKINGIRSHIAREVDANARWTSYHRLYDRYFYRDNCRREDGADAPPAAELAGDPSPSRTPAEREEPPRKGFRNNPFEELKEKNLDLF
jgi:3'-5' exoribonuclease